MLTYIINVISDMLLWSLVIGITFAFIDNFSSDKGRIPVRVGAALGLIAAGVRAYITNTRRLSGGWKVGAFGYGVTLVLFAAAAVALIACSKKYFAKDKDSDRFYISDTLVSSFSGLLIAGFSFCSLPNVMVYPFKFDTGDNGILSTEYLFRLGGYLIGLITCFASIWAVYKIIGAAVKKGSGKFVCAVFYLANTIYAVFCFAKLMAVLTPRKIIDSTALFKFAAASNNRSHLYTYAVFVLMLALGVYLWIRSIDPKEPYTTNAQRRKQRAVWRTARRFTVMTAVCFVMCILSATLFVKLNEVVIREAPVEQPLSDGESLRVPFEMVEDGHLHRFGYDTEDGKTVRFIVVLKTENTNNYGVGLDACEICGEAGYYENKDEQIVCKKCNVVMNRTTIGMKGGCNPIIIDYDIDDDGIIVPIEEMEKNKDRFKN